MLVGFGRALRDAGLVVGSGRVLGFCRAVARLDPADQHDLYWAGRACLIARHEDIPLFDQVFARYFGGAREGLVVTASGALPHQSTVLAGDGHLLRRSPASSADQTQTPVGSRASEAELLRHKHFPQCTAEEFAALQALMARLRLTPPMRRTRRTSPATRGAHPDLRRAIRRSLRTQGQLLHPSWRVPRARPRRIVLILDISGSMAGYSRALLQFAHSATSSPLPRTEVFCFGTRLTRITRQLRHRDPDQALAEAASAVLDWDGGTRIGDSLDTFVREWGRRGLARGSVVVICSDGLERGDPRTLQAVMARLDRLAHRVVWVNPLKGDPRYQPLARGMQAALPFVDVFVSGHDLSSLESLAALLPQLA